MCGLLFELSKSNLLDKNSFLELLTLSKKRGPDNQGYWSNNTSIQLGFNRLAILELTEAGNQPMVSPLGRYVVVFNGEVYNHSTLRDQLRFNKFRGHSDTETLCACFDEWGIDKTIEQLDGMFAIAVYDQQTQITSLVRDFAGIKPLFYGWNGNTLVAASQYDQVIKHPAFTTQPIDEQVLKLYLQQHFVPAPFGLLKNTHQVEPGEMMTLDKEGKINKRRYWELPDYFKSSVLEQSHAIEVINESINSAVKDELLSDVPLGAFLSGGIDSPLVCYYAKQHQRQLKTFTIGSDSKVHDESETAAIYAHLLETKHYLSRMDATSCETLLNSALGSLHEPMADFSIIPTYSVARLAREQVTVVLSGDGADELFFGYERFWSIAKNIRYQNWPWWLKAGLYKGDQWISGNKNLNGVLLSKRQSEAHQNLHSRFKDEWLDKIFPDLRNTSLPERYQIYNFPNCKNENELIQHMRKAEFYGMMQKTLRKVDLASMENSLEVRVPFLKKSFIEASLKIDPFLSYGGGRKKQILKDLLFQKLPGSPIDEIKRGFTVPLGKWIKEDLQETFKERLLDTNFCNKYGMPESEVEALLLSHYTGNDKKWPIFTLVALSAWNGKINV